MLTIEVGTGDFPADNSEFSSNDHASTTRTIERRTPPSSANTDSKSGHEPWINGLRGLAALQVVIFHYITPEAFFIYESAWVPPEHPGPRILKLIPVRLLAQGDAMARLFFILSGYCIALGFQKKAKNSSSIQYYRKLTSVVFRRSFRLFVPFVFVAVLGHVLWFFGAYAEEPPDLRNFCPDALDLQWTVGLHNSLWSVPLELRGSFATYTALLGLANTRPGWRISIIAALASYNFFYSTKDLTGFFAGMLIAEVQSHVAARNSGLGKRIGSLPEHFRATLSTLAITAGLYLLSLPMKLHDDPIDTLPPDYDFLRALYLPHWKSAGDYGWGAYYVGSTMLLAGLLGTPRLRQSLTVSPLQSLGNISYSLSLVHFAVKWTCQRRILWIVSQIIGLEEKDAISKGVSGVLAPLMLVRFVAFIVYLGITVACASVLTIEMEQPSKEWAYKMEQWMSSPEQE